MLSDRRLTGGSRRFGRSLAGIRRSVGFRRGLARFALWGSCLLTTRWARRAGRTLRARATRRTILPAFFACSLHDHFRSHVRLTFGRRDLGHFDRAAGDLFRGDYFGLGI